MKMLVFKIYKKNCKVTLLRKKLNLKQYEIYVERSQVILFWLLINSVRFYSKFFKGLISLNFKILMLTIK